MVQIKKKIGALLFLFVLLFCAIFIYACFSSHVFIKGTVMYEENDSIWLKQDEGTWVLRKSDDDSEVWNPGDTIVICDPENIFESSPGIIYGARKYYKE